MGWSFRFGTVAGIALKVHASFLLVVALGAMQWGGFGLEGAVFGALLTVLTFASVTLHELGHSLVALKFGIPVKDITLYPLGGVARLGGRPRTPGQEFLIAIAGPAVNVVLVGLIGWAGVAWFGWDTLTDALLRARAESPSLATLVAMVISSNAVLAVFNLVPALPMDGGRVLRAVLQVFVGAEKATRTSATIARVLSAALFALGVISRNPMLCIIAVFVFVGAGQEVRDQQLAHVLDGVQVGDALNPYAPRFTPGTTLGDAVMQLTATRYEAFAVEHGGRLAGVVSRKAILDAAGKQGAWGAVASVMVKECPSIDPRERLEAARAVMDQAGVPWVAVVKDGLFYGLLTELELAVVTERVARLRFGRGEASDGEWRPR